MYTFKDFTALSSTELENVLYLRNQPFVREWMFNKNIITWEEHLNFIEGLKEDNSRLYLYVLRNNEFIGVYSVSEIIDQIGQGGFYITSDAIKKKLAFEFLYFCLKEVYENHASTLYGFEEMQNKNAYSLNRAFGFYKNLDQNESHLIEGIEHRYGELTKENFNQISVSVKIQKLIQFSADIDYKFHLNTNYNVT